MPLAWTDSDSHIALRGDGHEQGAGPGAGARANGVLTYDAKFLTTVRELGALELWSDDNICIT